MAIYTVFSFETKDESTSTVLYHLQLRYNGIGAAIINSITIIERKDYHCLNENSHLMSRQEWSHLAILRSLLKQDSFNFTTCTRKFREESK